MPCNTKPRSSIKINTQRQFESDFRLETPESFVHKGSGVFPLFMRFVAVANMPQDVANT